MATKTNKFNKYFVLNEAEGTDDIKQITFDADALFQETQATIRTHMLKILESKPEEWDIVKNARKQMEAMKKGADEEIKTSIAHVCRTANNGDMNLGGKLMAFVSKHPMRAAKLTNLWNRHMVDLDQRIEQRIKQISELDGKGPLQMAKQFYTQTFPALIAMMFVYKTLLRMYNDERLFDPTIILKAQSQQQQVSPENYISVVLEKIAEIFAANSTKLNDDGIEAISLDEGQNEVAPNSLTYILIWVLQLLNAEKIDEAILDEAIQISDNLQTITDRDTLLSRILDMLLDMGSGDLASCLINMQESFNKTNPEQAKQLAELINSNKEVFTNITSNDLVPSILKYIYATNGDILINFQRNQQLFTDQNIDLSNDQKVDELKTALGIKDTEIPDNALQKAQKAVTAAAPAFTQMFGNEGRLNLAQVYRAYFALGLNTLDNKTLNLNTALMLFLQLATNQTTAELLAGNINTEAYAQIVDAFGSDFNTIEAYNRAVAVLAKNDRTIISGLDLKKININNDKALEPFSIDLNSKDFFGCEIGDVDKTLFNNNDFGSIKSPIKSGNDIVKEITSDNKWPIVYKTLKDLFTLDVELQEKVHWSKDGLDKLRQLGIYVIQCAYTKFNSGREIDTEFEQWLKTPNINVGNGNKQAFTVLIPQWISLRYYEDSNSGSAGVQKLQQIIGNADRNINAQFKEGTVDNFLSSLMNKDVNMADADKMLKYINDKIYIVPKGQQKQQDEDGENPKTDPKLLAAFKDYLMQEVFNDPKKFPAVQNFCETPSVITNVAEEQKSAKSGNDTSTNQNASTN